MWCHSSMSWLSRSVPSVVCVLLQPLLCTVSRGAGECVGGVCSVGLTIWAMVESTAMFRLVPCTASVQLTRRHPHQPPPSLRACQVAALVTQVAVVVSFQCSAAACLLSSLLVVSSPSSDLVMLSARLSLTALLVAVLAGVVLSADSSSPASSATFNFHDYLVGEWDVLKSSPTSCTQNS